MEYHAVSNRPSTLAASLTTFVVAVFVVVIAVLGISIGSLVSVNQLKSNTYRRWSAEDSIPPQAEIVDGVNWNGWGGVSEYNQRYAVHETAITTSNVHTLKKIWEVTVGKGVSATPTVVDGYAYYPDWDGYLWKRNAKTGDLAWQFNITKLIIDNIGTGLMQYASITRPTSRTSPVIVGDTLFFGTQMGCLLVAINKNTGSVKWVKRLSTHNAAIITQSFTVYNGTIYVGTSSWEESFARLTGYVCCTFIGSFGAYDAETGRTLWRNYMLPDNGGASNLYAGVSVWGSAPVIDLERNQVYIGTGNTYRNPDYVEQCRSIADEYDDVLINDPCFEEGVYENSIMAFDLHTGRINWNKHMGEKDSWTIACGLRAGSTVIPRNSATCPQVPGPDADFAQAPIFIEGSPATPHGEDVLVIGQKSGFVWALNPNTGKLLWSSAPVPGGDAGGLEWGSATDRNYFFYASANAGLKNHTIKIGTSSATKTISGGSWGALSVKTGSIVWQTENPTSAMAFGAVSVANGVVFAGSRDTNGTFFALSAANGSILRKIPLGTAIYGGASIVEGLVFIGTGYNTLTTGKLVVLGL